MSKSTALRRADDAWRQQVKKIADKYKHPGTARKPGAQSTSASVKSA